MFQSYKYNLILRMLMFHFKPDPRHEQKINDKAVVFQPCESFDGAIREFCNPPVSYQKFAKRKQCILKIYQEEFY